MEVTKIKLLMIGNGLDIGNHLNTKPEDFKKYVKENDSYLYNIAVQILYKSPHLQTEDVFWNNVEYRLKDPSIPPTNSENALNPQPDIPNSDNIIDYFVDHLNCNLKNWIGTVEKNINTSCKKNNDYCEWINKADTFVNFNYTSTLEKLYSIQESNDFHIHGSYCDHPQIGHKKVVPKSIDDMYDSCLRTENNEDTINKLLKDTEKDTDRNYINLKEFLKKRKPNITDIYSIGLSFSEVDCVYLNYMEEDKFITQDTNWHIGIYTDSEKDNIKKNINSALKFNIDSKHFETKNFSENNQQ